MDQLLEVSGADEARQSAPAGAAKVFVSYSRKDIDFAQMLVAALRERGFDAFLDKTDIAPGEPWQERLSALIALADTVAFIVSPDSARSQVCRWELEESARLGKRILPVVCRSIADTDAPPALGRLNWIFCTTPGDREPALAQLDEALRTDLPWVREHTRLGELARRWDEQGRGNGASLRGKDVEAAERWLDRRPADANAPTGLHQDFIRASRRAATRRQRGFVGAALAVAVVAIALAAWAEVNRRDAQAQRERAEVALEEAKAQRDRAEHNLGVAMQTSNTLVNDLARQLREVKGIPVATVKFVLDLSRKMQDTLFASGESSPEMRASQAISLEEYSTTLLALGETGEALALATRARDTDAALVASQPGNYEWRHNLSVGEVAIGDALRTQGHLKEALAAFERALAVRLELSRERPESAFDSSSLSISYSRAGDVLAKQGHPAEALAALRHSVEIREALLRKEPTKGHWKDLLAGDEADVGDILRDQGHLAEALDADQKVLDTRKALAADEPLNSRWQSALATAQDHLAEDLTRSGKLDAALADYRDGQLIRKSLTLSDPTNLDWQSALASSDGLIGDTLRRQGHLEEALVAYRDGHALIEKLTAKDPTNTEWQSDLALSFDRIGNIFALEKRFDEALTIYEAALSVSEPLVKQDPTNAVWQAYHTAIAGRFGSVAYNFLLLKEYDKALAASDRAIATTPDQIWLYTNRAHALMFLGRLDEARAIYLKYRGRIILGEPWEKAVRDDFAEFRKAGLTSPLMDEIATTFAQEGSAAEKKPIDAPPRN